jgi:hypothetical protein
MLLSVGAWPGRSRSAASNEATASPARPASTRNSPRASQNAARGSIAIARSMAAMAAS